MEPLLVAFAALLFGTGLVSAVAAALGWYLFLAPILLLAWLTIIGSAAYLLARRRLMLVGDRHDLMALALALLAALSAGLLPHVYFRGHTDVGFYLNDAYIMATTGGRSIDGPFDDLLPGFIQEGESYRVSAMFGYSALGALFAYIGGYFAIPWVNAPLAFVTTLSLYSITRRLDARFGAVLAAFFFSASILTIWFHRWVMSENAAAAVFWTSTLVMLALASRWRNDYAVGLLVMLVYGCLVRPEGILVAAWFVLALLAIHRKKAWAWTRGLFRHAGRARLLLPIVAAVFLATLYGVLSPALPLEYLRRSGDVVEALFRGRAGADAFDVQLEGPSPTWADYAFRYEWDSASEYFLPWFLAVAVVGLALRIVPRRRAALLVLLVAPYFLFLLLPPVTTFHPWYMRRMSIAVVPALYVLAGAAVDPLRVGLRWPMRRKRDGRPQPRATAYYAAIGVILLLTVPTLGTSQPAWFNRESDGTRGLVPALHAAVPSDSRFVVDQDLVGFSTPLRLIYGHDVVPLFQRIPYGIERAFAAEASGGPLYVARYNSSIDFPTMSVEAISVGSVRQIPVEVHFSPRQNHRAYISTPPLEEGYAPLREYLDTQVPPREWVTVTINVDLIEVVSPLVVSKNAEFAPNGWNAGPDGLVAATNESSILIDPAIFSEEFRERRSLTLYVYLESTQSVDGSWRWLNATGSGNLTGPSMTAGAGGVRAARFDLPVPMDVRRILVPAGLALRGVYVGPPE